MTKSTAVPNAASSAHAPLGFKSFVALMAAMMALNALATDMMLPAFPLMAHDFGLTNANRIQLIISAYLIGLGCGQMFVGVLADRYGRKVVLLTGIALYSASAVRVIIYLDIVVSLFSHAVIHILFNCVVIALLWGRLIEIKSNQGTMPILNSRLYAF